MLWRVVTLRRNDSNHVLANCSQLWQTGIKPASPADGKPTPCHLRTPELGVRSEAHSEIFSRRPSPSCDQRETAVCWAVAITITRDHMPALQSTYANCTQNDSCKIRAPSCSSPGSCTFSDAVSSGFLEPCADVSTFF